MAKEKRLIDRQELSRILKEYFCTLITSGNDFVEITEINAELQKIIGMMPSEEGIEWYDAEWELPTVSDEYLVMIANADKPTVLDYDVEDQIFFHEVEGETILYKVTRWAELPGGKDA